MLKIAFCDDETAEIAQLEELLEEYAAARGQEFVHTSYQSSVELMADIEKGKHFDIMLLDILMPGENGMTAAREVREHEKLHKPFDKCGFSDIRNADDHCAQSFFNAFFI